MSDPDPAILDESVSGSGKSSFLLSDPIVYFTSGSFSRRAIDFFSIFFELVNQIQDILNIFTRDFVQLKLRILRSVISTFKKRLEYTHSIWLYEEINHLTAVLFVFR